MRPSTSLTLFFSLVVLFMTFTWPYIIALAIAGVMVRRRIPIRRRGMLLICKLQTRRANRR